jgi:NAD(P)-dependent dehydrogenase (short-subunit alcohol dehydrogenase family)
MSNRLPPGDDLAGRVVIVTGAGRGIGRGIARHLGSRGTTVVVAEHRAKRLDDVAAELAAAGVDHLGVTCDVGVREQVDAMVAATIARYGRVDGIVNNAVSLVASKPLEEVTEADMDVLHRTGTNGTLFAMQAVFPHMRAQGWGRIVNVGSAAGIRGSMGTAPYNACKEAIRALTRTAAREWAVHGIVVNCYCPASAGHHQVPPVGDPHREAWDAMYATHPMGRDGDPDDDVGPAVAFLLSDACRWMTGETLMLDGGGHLRA